MLDPRLFRADLDFVKKQLSRRSVDFNAEYYAELEARRKDIQVKTQDLQNERNSRSKSIGQAKAKGEDIQPLLDQVQHMANQLKDAEMELSEIQAKMTELMEGIPNILDESVPDGKNEADNIEISRWGEIPVFDFEPKDHVDLGARNKRMDFELGAKIASARFVVLNGALARLQRALIQFMLDTHVSEHGYSETYVPF
ncbi:MAG: serine--tRNA ligase, partial [Methylobacter sp.]